MFTASKFPLYRQYDAMQCGVACLRMVCAHFGRQFSMEELSELCPTTSEGVSMLGISRAAEELGLHTACGRLTVDVLATAPLPCILHWNQNHFVVLHRISAEGKAAARSTSPTPPIHKASKILLLTIKNYIYEKLSFNYFLFIILRNIFFVQ